MSRTSRHNRTRLSLFFGIVTAVAVVIVVAVIGVFLILSKPQAAVVTLGIGCCLMGVARGIWPGHPWFGSRNKVADVAVFVVVGLALLLMASAVSVAAPR